jgi:S1-C subfamily serine protease
MRARIFWVDEELPSDSPFYVERSADRDALLALQTMAYISIPAPRQQGTTSLIKRLSKHPLLTNFAFVHLDTTKFDWTNEEQWYWSIYSHLSSSIPDLVMQNWIRCPLDVAGCHTFLSAIASIAASEDRNVVIALDKFGVVWKEWAASFLSILRSLYNSRSIKVELNRLTFVIVGPFIPDKLIKQIEVSPFNVAKTIQLADFSEDQVRLLVKKLGHWDERTALIAKRIWSYTGGQPCLTQLICQKLSKIEHTPRTEDVDRIAQSLHREDQRHIVPLLDRWITDSRLVAYTQRILNGEQVRFSPFENRRQGTLSLLGILKADADGYCAIRNPIYEWALREALEVTGEASSTKHLLATHTEEIMRLPLLPELNDALSRLSLAIFIGADLPREVTSLPSRADLARELAQRKGLDISLSLAEVAQRVARGGNRWEFTAFIRDQLDNTGKSPQPFHRRIVELVQEHEIKTLITTAYDNLLELAFQEAGVPINCVVCGSDVSFIYPDRPMLIKLYGDAQQPDTLVVTEDDHYDLWRDRDKEDLLQEVKTVLRRQTVLFLGYNLADPDFNLLWREVLDRAGRFNRTAYAVWPSLPEEEVRMWQDRGIVILDTDPLGILGDLAAPSTLEGGTEPTPESPELASVLTVYPEHDGRPYKAGPAQWFSRLRVETETPVDECWGKIYAIRQLDGPSDHQGNPVPEFHASCLSWGSRGESGVFGPISIHPTDTDYLDLAWRAHGDPQIPRNQLRVASALEHSERNTESSDWGKRQDFIPLEPGYYFLTVQIWAKGYHAPWERTYQLHWPGSGQEDDIRLVEAADKRAESMGDSSVLESAIEGNGMDYELGFRVLKTCLAEADSELQSEAATLEDRFWKNQRADRLFGGSENTRNERSQIIFSLNDLALKHCSVSFNALCQGAEPTPLMQTQADPALFPQYAEETVNWRQYDIMNPELFVEKDEVPGLVRALMKFSNKFPVASDRRDILGTAGLDSSFISSLKFDANSVVFANALLARFRDYKVSEQRLDYHPMVAFLSFLNDTGPTNYGLEDQDIALCAQLIERSKENLKALQACSAVGRIESPKGTGIGTGFLVGKDLLLTCRHVFSKHYDQPAWVRFGYKAGSYELTKDLFELDMKFVQSSNQPDYALIRIKGLPERQIIRPVRKVLSAGMSILTAHHPQGQHVIISNLGQISQVGEDYIAHDIPTAEGSSGAPIFDCEWELIAIHRGDPGLGRNLPEGMTEGIPIYAIWEKISSDLV